MATLSPALLLSLAILATALITDLWVLTDARKREQRGQRAEVRAGNLHISTPEAWFLGTLLLWPVFQPLYLTATGRNPFERRT